MLADLEIEKEVELEMVWKPTMKSTLCQFSDKHDCPLAPLVI